MPEEREVSMRGEDVTPARLRSLAELPDLEKLVIWGGRLTNDVLAPLSQLTWLKGLVLGEMPIDDGVFAYLKTLRELAYLNLAYTYVEGDFTPLTGLPLRDVRLEGCRRVGDRCARTLAAFPTLRQLEIHMTGLTDEGVHHLAHTPLEVLWLAGRISDRGMDAVATMANLMHLDVCTPGVTDAGVSAIAGLSRLRVLWLNRCRVTDASIDVLAGMPALRELSINKTGITPEGRSRLRTLLPGCRLVDEGADG